MISGILIFGLDTVVVLLIYYGSMLIALLARLGKERELVDALVSKESKEFISFKFRQLVDTEQRFFKLYLFAGDVLIVLLAVNAFNVLYWITR